VLCARPAAADSSGADFAPLLAHLPAASHAVLLVDVARLRAALDAFADRLATSPLFAGHPELAADAARARALVERLPGLGAPRGAEFMLRLRVELPAWVNAAAAAPGQRPLDTLFGSWRRFGLELGAGFAMDAAAADAAGAERLEMVWRAWRELMLGGAYMWRAYALLLLGLDLSQLPGLPPFAQRALADRQALQQTLELVFPAPSGQVRMARQGRSVRLSAPPRMLQGALFVMGIGAAIAIPLLLRQLDTAGPPSDSGGHLRRKK
jgi:hypothetical protein